MMAKHPKVEIIPTRDGSPTLRTAAGITYHSTHGAVQESRHVFIQTGFHEALRVFQEEEICVFEMGFGTGLNAFLTALEAEKTRRNVRFFSVEKYPVEEAIWQQLSYPQNEEERNIFDALHPAPWEEMTTVSSHFELQKMQGSLEEILLPQNLHLIYFDAFAPEDAPQLWTESIFQKLYDALLPGGVFVTYCSKGIVRRALQSAGFMVEKLPGPPGKREIVRARKA